MIGGVGGRGGRQVVQSLLNTVTRSKAGTTEGLERQEKFDINNLGYTVQNEYVLGPKQLLR